MCETMYVIVRGVSIVGSVTVLRVSQKPCMSRDIPMFYICTDLFTDAALYVQILVDILTGNDIKYVTHLMKHLCMICSECEHDDLQSTNMPLSANVRLIVYNLVP